MLMMPPLQQMTPMSSRDALPDADKALLMQEIEVGALLPAWLPPLPHCSGKNPFLPHLGAAVHSYAAHILPWMPSPGGLKTFIPEP